MARGKGSHGGERSLRVRVKSAKGRKISSTRWLDRQLNDPYVQAAKREGYRARAAYKLLELDDKYHFLKPGLKVVDLGAAPGGWSQVAAARVKSDGGPGLVVSVDMTEIKPISGVTFLQLDFTAPEADIAVKSMLGGPADIVLSDMAAPSTGHRQTDHMRIMSLCEAAADFAIDVLNEGGVFCAKVLRGGTEHELLAMLKKYFKLVRHVKPKASRADSAEMYVLATGFRKSGESEPGSLSP